MPKYYYHIDELGQVLCLVDCEDKKDYATVQDIVILLEKEKALAIKLFQGEIGKGFYKAEYNDGIYLLNNKKCTKEELISEISSLKNYLVTEYLYPHNDIAEIYRPTLNPVRFVAGKFPGGNLHYISSFIRYGTSRTGSVENFNRGGILCYIDENGYFKIGHSLQRKGKKLFIKDVKEHPDTKKTLQGRIPMFDDMKKCVNLIDKTFPELKYIGIDFAITDKNEIKILEINSLTSLDALQIEEPFNVVKKIFEY